ncbi:TPA: hypothetical protein ACIBH9_001551 [Salmonella enterica subsp. diarizonae serovar 61:l,v:z35]
MNESMNAKLVYTGAALAIVGALTRIPGVGVFTTSLTEIIIKQTPAALVASGYTRGVSGILSMLCLALPSLGLGLLIFSMLLCFSSVVESGRGKK